MEVYSVKSKGIEPVKPAPAQSSEPVEHKTKKPDNSGQITIRQQKKLKTEVPQIQFPKLLEIAQQVGERLKSAGVNIQFEINQSMGRIVIKVMDPVTGKVVRQIPPEAFMKSVAFLNEMKEKYSMQGLEIDVLY